MTPERKLFDEVRDYITDTIKRMNSTATAIEMAEMKFGRKIVDGWMKDTIRQLRRVVPDDNYPHMAAAMAAVQEKEN